MALSKKAETLLNEMIASGQSETMGVADILQTIASNGEEMEKDENLIGNAAEIRDAATYFIHQMEQRKETPTDGDKPLPIYRRYIE
jgi:hypothetical protein